MEREVISAICYGIFAFGGAFAVWSLCRDVRRALQHRKAIKRRLEQIRNSHSTSKESSAWRNVNAKNG